MLERIFFLFPYTKQLLFTVNDISCLPYEYNTMRLFICNMPHGKPVSVINTHQHSDKQFSPN